MRRRTRLSPRTIVSRALVSLLCVSAVFLSLNRLTGRVFVDFPSNSDGWRGYAFGSRIENTSGSGARHDVSTDVNGQRVLKDDTKSGSEVAGEQSGDIDSVPKASNDSGASSASGSDTPQETAPFDKGLIPSYITSILDPSSSTHPLLSCPPPPISRYFHLKDQNTKYFFALDLHQCINILPRLIGTLLETIKYLGPSHCILSIVEGRSTDGTADILSSPDLLQELERTGIQYHLQSSTVNPNIHGDLRIRYLAELRNLALAPLFDNSNAYDPASTTVVFLNDVAVCMEDVLELITQRDVQKADMVCGMDWTYVLPDPTFYDVWVARDMKGATFFNINSSGSWDEAFDMFPKNDETRIRYEEHKPFQVFSCWNGMIVVSAEPFLAPKRSGSSQEVLRFRGSKEGECFEGEPQLLCKDLWFMGYNRIAVVPSVNLGYFDWGEKIKTLKGYVSDFTQEGWDHNEEDVDHTQEGVDEEGLPVYGEGMKIAWQEEPPKLVKCWKSYDDQKWLPWDESLGKNRTWLGQNTTSR